MNGYQLINCLGLDIDNATVPGAFEKIKKSTKPIIFHNFKSTTLEGIKDYIVTTLAFLNSSTDNYEFALPIPDGSGYVLSVSESDNITITSM